MNRWKSIEHVQSKRDQASIWNRENVARLFTRQVRPVPKQLSFLIFSGFSKFLSSAVLKISLKISTSIAIATDHMVPLCVQNTLHQRN